MTDQVLFLRACDASGHPDLESILKQEIEALGAGRLPLAQGLTIGSHVAGDVIQARIISVVQDDTRIQVRAGIFFEGILAGCSCADDPTPVEPQNEYCEIQFDIDKTTARATITPLP